MTIYKLVLIIGSLLPSWGAPAADSENPFNVEPVRAAIDVYFEGSTLQMKYWDSHRLLIIWE